MCAATAYNGFKAIGLAANGRTTEATVTQVESYPRGDITTIRFTAGAEEVTTECDSCPSGLSVGDQITVIYQPNAPATVEPAGSGDYQALALLTGALLLVTLTAAAFVGWRLFRERRRV
jgi:hypothetical protein